MNFNKAVARAEKLNALTRNKPFVSYDVVGTDPDCVVRQINKDRRTGEEKYGVGAY